MTPAGVDDTTSRLPAGIIPREDSSTSSCFVMCDRGKKKEKDSGGLRLRPPRRR